MIFGVIGLCLVGGGLKGMVDNLLKPKPPRPLREHTSVYSQEFSVTYKICELVPQIALYKEA